MSIIRRIFGGQEGQEPAPVWLRFLKGLLIAIIFGGAGVGAVYGLHQHRAEQAWSGENCIYRDELRLVGSGWMTPQIIAEVNASFQELPPRMSLMDSRTMSLIWQCLERNPWVRRVVRVRLDSTLQQSPGRGLEVVVEFRQPVAFVQVGGLVTQPSYVLVDGEGVRLGVAPFAEPVLGNRLLPTIEGVTTDAPPAGWRWDDPAVLAGAEVATCLGAEAAAMGLAAIDVTNVGGRINPLASEITLRSRSGTLVHWGSPQSVTADALEGTPRQKLAVLRHAWRNPGLDKLAEVHLVEGWQRRHAGRTASGRGLHSRR